MIAPIGVLQIVAAASNVRTGENPVYTTENFLVMYPQFSKVPEVVVRAWVKIAHASLNINRYHDLWEVAMGLFIAHYLTLYLQTTANPDDPVGKIISAGLAKGLQTFKSASDLSVSYDFTTVAQDFAGWGTYKQTAFGQQFITFAKIAGMGGVGVW